jgi:hypothetical protein
MGTTTTPRIRRRAIGGPRLLRALLRITGAAQ